MIVEFYKHTKRPEELNPSNRVEVTISANPSNGTFQALLYLKDTTNLNNSGIDDWMLEGDLLFKDVHSVKIVRLPRESNPSDRVEVTLSVNPSNGLFQALLYLKDTTNLNNSGIDDWMLEGDVSRLDFQSVCINDRVVRKYRYYIGIKIKIIKIRVKTIRVIGHRCALVPLPQTHPQSLEVP
uniref:Uncharacterized protein n=1 Tax=Tetranychus urticae TaxID=32264 RepID=T1KBP4_TETUR